MEKRNAWESRYGTTPERKFRDIDNPIARNVIFRESCLGGITHTRLRLVPLCVRLFRRALRHGDSFLLMLHEGYPATAPRAEAVIRARALQTVPVAQLRAIVHREEER